MTKRFSLPRLLGVLAAISCTCATLAVAAQVAPKSENSPPDTSGIIILDISAPEKGDMPPVAFDHNKHTRGEKPGETCASCHEGSAAAAIKASTGKDLENAFHDACLTCHADVKSKGKASPPQKAECRSCHDASALPVQHLAAGGKTAQSKTEPRKTPQTVDGGFDASLHARHVASDKITVSGNRDNCASCHHATKIPLSSPGLRADSCRSCHPATLGAKGADKAPPYSRVAHATCITCHASFAAKGESLPLTCDSCHSATKKAGYAKLAPAPRLMAGQPDVVVMGGPSPVDYRDLPLADSNQALPDARLAKSKQPQPSMAPVPFDHKRHEASVDTCRTCHMPTGKGAGTVTVSMHKADASLTCMSCHNEIKATKAECAGCHAIMPAAKVTETRCESCHNANIPGMRLKKISPVTGPGYPALERPAGESLPTAGVPAGALEKAALEKAPASISIGVLSKEYEPSVFPHKRVVESLIAGMENSASGMAAFHNAPYALCASCHHNSPPSAKPPSCATCHSTTAMNTVASRPAATLPSLQAAYHQQCISCHTAMAVKPAATECAGCHAKRAMPAKGGR